MDRLQPARQRESKATKLNYTILPLADWFVRLASLCPCVTCARAYISMSARVFVCVCVTHVTIE